ncbi:putative bifunctional diguanylate cyclase/phosphodiesterase [Alteripontixanthobacter muriae]|uniref:putative bifunctional diguanylate cyclase/phosphodiesterase n=1 Tax=Alteripontixanthobacter muriae TaxID=2705546 RepID=UPI001E366110|nr:bifunctional diguanylate cyclase/phosphodiesterase [Alteripontixanthobacter muriae]
MKLLADREKFAAGLLVFMPLVVLSVIFAALALALFFNERIEIANATAMIVTGGLAYAVAVALLGRFGMNNIARLEQLGLTDSLSQLPNRRALHLDIRRDTEAGEEIALALIDLDGFKLVNDHYGHFVGDVLIRRIADVLKEVLGTEARCYRLGGDEFALVMEGPLAGTILEGMCRAFLEKLEKPIIVEDRRIVIGASIGLSRGRAGESASSELLRQSDVAMYASKRGGKMRCTWFSPKFDRDLEALRAMDEDMRHALAHEEFRVHYQPLVDARTGAVTAVESLLRWPRANGEMVGPHIFIPVAEESGFINAIGLWVLRQACTDAMTWNDIKLSVNISAAQLRNPEFPIELGQILEETGFPPERLELEITETCLVLDPVVAERSLQLIRKFGVNVVLDDFGTGYASIGFLRQFRFEKLKLDRSLIVDAEADEGSRAMMLSSISVARAMKMDVTAEGVETEAQADLARMSGCDQIQGWLYYKAMPADQIAQHLEKSESPQPGSARKVA